MKYLIYIFLFLSLSLSAADLPEKGMEPPPVVNAGPKPPNPGVPVGNGISVVLAFAVLYTLKKRNK